MALQGTLETFALPDVLRLLASTKKTGVLRVETDRGAGELLVVDGELTGGSASRAPRADRPADVLFEMLRTTDGSFVFDADASPSGGGAPQDVESALADAEAQLAEWREIEAVVPSPHRLVTLRSERDAAITLDPPQWRAVAALAGGCTVDELGGRLDLPELATARTIRDLVELGAVDLGDHDVAAVDAAPAPQAASAPVPEPAPAPEPAFEPLRLADEPVAEAPAELADRVDGPNRYDAEDTFSADPYTSEETSSEDSFSSGGVSGLPPLPGVEEHRNGTSFGGDGSGFAPAAPSSFGDQEPPLAPVAPLFGGSHGAEAPSSEPAAWSNDQSFGTSPASSFFDDDDEDDPLADDPFGPDPFRIPKLPTVETATDPEAAEMARQLANLSPRAAQAVAAAAAATSAEERDQALAQVPQEGDEPVNRGLLLKFLSSVDE